MQNSAPALIRDLRAQLRRELPEYMIPAAIVLLDALPLNANGKVDTGALPEPDRAAAASTEYVPPRDAIEEQVAAIWMELLRTPRVGAFDNFFELGGNSLLAMRVISWIRQAFGVEIPVASIFENPTVAGAADAVRQRQNEEPEDMETLLRDLENLSEEEAAERLSSFGAAPGGAA